MILGNLERVRNNFTYTSFMDYNVSVRKYFEHLLSLIFLWKKLDENMTFLNPLPINLLICGWLNSQPRPQAKVGVWWKEKASQEVQENPPLTHRVENNRTPTYKKRKRKREEKNEKERQEIKLCKCQSI